MDYIHEHTSEELYHIFSPYLPGYTASDFYELEIGSAGDNAWLYGAQMR